MPPISDLDNEETPESPATPARPHGSSILYALGRLSAQLEEARSEVKNVPNLVSESLNPLAARVSSLEPRVATLERARWRFMGAASIVTIIIGVVDVAVTPALHFWSSQR